MVEFLKSAEPSVFEAPRLVANRVDGRDTSHVGIGNTIALLSGSLSAVTADVAERSAAVAGLAGGVERTTVRGGAIAGDMARLAASVALHGLSLAVTSEVVRATTLVAGGRAAAELGGATEAGSAVGTTGSHRGTAAKARAGRAVTRLQIFRQKKKVPVTIIGEKGKLTKWPAKPQL